MTLNNKERKRLSTAARNAYTNSLRVLKESGVVLPPLELPHEMSSLHGFINHLRMEAVDAAKEQWINQVQELRKLLPGVHDVGE